MCSTDLELTDNWLTLRPVIKSDTKGMYQAIIESKETHQRWFPWLHENYSIVDTKAWVEKQENLWNSEAELSFVITEKNRPAILGCIGLNRFDRVGSSRANLGYWVHGSETGRGIAPAAAKLLAKYAFEERNLQRLEIVTSVDNIASQRVAEKLGAHNEGIARNRVVDNDVVADAIVFSLIPADMKKWE